MKIYINFMGNGHYIISLISFILKTSFRNNWCYSS